MHPHASLMMQHACRTWDQCHAVHELIRCDQKVNMADKIICFMFFCCEGGNSGELTQTIYKLQRLQNSE